MHSMGLKKTKSTGLYLLYIGKMGQLWWADFADPCGNILTVRDS